MSVNLNIQLSDNFYLSEFVKSSDAIRQGIDNTVGLTDVEVTNLRELCFSVLQPVRSHYGQVVTVHSGYRSEKLNEFVKSKPTSDHRTGSAADIEIIGISNVFLATWIYKNLNFHKVILEFYDGKDPNSGWVHVSYRSPTENVKQGYIINASGTTPWKPA